MFCSLCLGNVHLLVGRTHTAQRPLPCPWLEPDSAARHTLPWATSPWIGPVQCVLSVLLCILPRPLGLWTSLIHLFYASCDLTLPSSWWFNSQQSDWGPVLGGNRGSWGSYPPHTHEEYFQQKWSFRRTTDPSGGQCCQARFGISLLDFTLCIRPPLLDCLWTLGAWAVRTTGPFNNPFWDMAKMLQLNYQLLKAGVFLPGIAVRCWRARHLIFLHLFNFSLRNGVKSLD